jgi:hypothetical protein
MFNFCEFYYFGRKRNCRRRINDDVAERRHGKILRMKEYGRLRNLMRAE